MAFDAGPRPEPLPPQPEPYRDEPVDYVDWGMRIAVFGPLFALYLHFIWTTIETVFGGMLTLWFDQYVG